MQSVFSEGAIVLSFAELASSVVSAGVRWESLPLHHISPPSPFPTEELETILICSEEYLFIQRSTCDTGRVCFHH